MKTGGGAFPIQDVNTQHTKGMTLRDYFAGQAVKLVIQAGCFGGILSATITAQLAYEVADAMILERDKRETSDKPLDLRHQDTKVQVEVIAKPTIIPEHEGNPL